jgi:hypothetical protein
MALSWEIFSIGKGLGATLKRIRNVIPMVRLPARMVIKAKAILCGLIKVCSGDLTSGE